MAIVKLPDGRWRVDVEPVKGKRFRKTLKTKGEALRFEAHCRANFEQLLLDSNSKRDKRHLSELVSVWFDMHGQNLRDATKRKSRLIAMTAALGDPVAKNLTAIDFARYRASRISSGIAIRTVNNDLCFLRAVYNELFSLTVIDYENPLKLLKPLKFQEKSLSFLSPGQINELLELLQSSGNPHVYPITLICLSTGCRWSEAENLQSKNLHDEKVVFEGTKSGKVRSVPVSPELVSMIKSHWLTFGGFTSSMSSFRRVLARCTFTLPQGQATHILRHTFASHFVQQGGNILTLQKILGHSTIVMTMRYAHLAPDHLTEALTLNPLASFDSLPTLNSQTQKSR